MLPEDLGSLQIPSDPSFSPDGSHYTYVVTRPNLEEDRYDSRIWVDDQPLTEGPGDSGPRWSPSGEEIVFLRRDENEKRQVHIVPAGGGDVRKLTDFELGVTSVEWAPDGFAIVAVATTYVDDWANLSDEERERRATRITTVPFKFDQLGWIHDRKRHLWLVAPDNSAEPRCITPGDGEEIQPAWSPDSKRIAYLTHTAEHKGLESGNELWEVDVTTGDRRQVGELGVYGEAGYNPDGCCTFWATPILAIQ